jgi:hypothetical protein
VVAEPLAAAERDGDDRDVHFVDQSRAEILLDGGRATAASFGTWESNPLRPQTSELGPGALHVGRLHDAVLPAHTSDGVTATIERSHQHEAASSPLSAVSSRYS